MVKLHLVPTETVAEWAAAQEQSPLASWGRAVLARLEQAVWPGRSAALTSEIEKLYASAAAELEKRGVPALALPSFPEAELVGQVEATEQFLAVTLERT